MSDRKNRRRTHLPAKSAADMDKWKLRIEAAALGVSASELLMKVIELAVTHLHVLSSDGSMDDQTKAKQQIEEDLNLEDSFPDLPKSYAPGPTVDWKSLSRLLMRTKQGINSTAEVDAQLESAFDQWVQGLSNYHKVELIGAIGEYTDK